MRRVQIWFEYPIETSATAIAHIELPLTGSVYDLHKNIKEEGGFTYIPSNVNGGKPVYMPYHRILRFMEV